MKSCPLFLAFLIFEACASASPRISPQTRQREPSIPLPTSFSVSASSGPDALGQLKKRQTTSGPTTCGYDNGDPTRPRTAAAGWACRVDTKNGLWGFCPATVIAATDCGLAGYCVDGSGCSGGCGILGASSLTTFTCNNAGSDFCSTALLIDGPDQTYSYIACAPNPGTEKLFVNPTFTSAAASTTQTSSSSKASSTPASLTSSSKSSSTSSSISQTPLPPSTSSSPSSSLSSSASSSSIQSAAPASASKTNNSSPGSTSDVGAIVGGVLGGLALIGFFVLAALFLLRKYRRDHMRSEVVAPPPTYEWGRKDSKVLANGYIGRSDSNYQKYGGYGPSELSTKQEPAELGS